MERAADDVNGAIGGLCDLAPQCAQTFKGAGAIGAGRKVLQLSSSVRQGGKHGVPMRDGLIAGQGKRAANPLCGLYQSCGLRGSGHKSAESGRCSTLSVPFFSAALARVAYPKKIFKCRSLPEGQLSPAVLILLAARQEHAVLVCQGFAASPYHPSFF